MIFNGKAFLALLISITGLVAHPEVMNLLPPPWALVLTIGGIVLQGFTQQIARNPSQREEDALETSER